MLGLFIPAAASSCCIAANAAQLAASARRWLQHAYAARSCGIGACCHCTARTPPPAVIGVACIYCALNIVLNNYTAYIFGSHPSQLMLDVPMTYSFSNHLLGFCVWSPLLLLMPNTFGRAKRATRSDGCPSAREQH